MVTFCRIEYIGHFEPAPRYSVPERIQIAQRCRLEIEELKNSGEKGPMLFGDGALMAESVGKPATEPRWANSIADRLGGIANTSTSLVGKLVGVFARLSDQRKDSLNLEI